MSDATCLPMGDGMSSACFAHTNTGWILYYVQGTLDYRQIYVKTMHLSINNPAFILLNINFKVLIKILF